VDDDTDLRLARLEHLMDRRPVLLNSVLLRQNPHNATEWGKRYGQNLTPQSYSTPGHVWHDAKDKNWGVWSCCGGAASSAPCQLRPTAPLPAVPSPETVGTGADASDISRTGVGAQIQFLIADKLLSPSWTRTTRRGNWTPAGWRRRKLRGNLGSGRATSNRSRRSHTRGRVFFR
jgi:hypothetical protein